MFNPKKTGFFFSVILIKLFFKTANKKEGKVQLLNLSNNLNHLWRTYAVLVFAKQVNSTLRAL